MITPRVEIPHGIKADISKVVRSLDFELPNSKGGLCFFRALSGCTVLRLLGFESAQPALGGMVFRAGPDDRRDVLAFCGPGNQGCSVNGIFLGHYWIVEDDDYIDFSVGDWRENAEMCKEAWHQADERQLCGESLDAIQWTAPELPDFFWTDRVNLTVSPQVNCKQHTPALGQAWYSGFRGDSETLKQFSNLIKEALPQIKPCIPHLCKAIEHYALKERLFAAREGHTAVRFSELAELIGDHRLMEKAKKEEHLIVLRGKETPTKEEAIRILTQAGLF
jgi:hypothetical protein